jgi:hypothetical protein
MSAFSGGEAISYSITRDCFAGKIVLLAMTILV